ncbi:hypothetical protein [Pseudoruegeria sp. SK021]|uniref:hypothetical protein n=1 Tax=Pseudoruegeria sp. SK021 TaxID=1933035 RepID=UPI000A23C105|nr:hypothetical protein [Pseudoruegeria sp. SK021]OSP56247.1 hypothetical protein BV911_02855 [Pseudoruegeria sp. SK021]
MTLRAIETHAIDFVNPVFQSGMNITVRSQEGWKDRIRLGDSLRITLPDREITVPVIGAIHCALADIPEGLLALEHDPAARTISGLQSVLENIYQRPVPLADAVTVLIFVVT